MSCNENWLDRREFLSEMGFGLRGLALVWLLSEQKLLGPLAVRISRRRRSASFRFSVRAGSPPWTPSTLSRNSKSEAANPSRGREFCLFSG